MRLTMRHHGGGHRDEGPDRHFSDSGWVGAGPDDNLEARLAAVAEAFDESQPHVMTVLGPIDPGALGVTLVGDWHRPFSRVGGERTTALIELERLYALGVRSCIELATGATAVARADLAWVSARSPIHLIASQRPSVGSADNKSGLRLGATGLGSASEIQRLPIMDTTLPVFIDGDRAPVGWIDRSGLDQELSERMCLTSVLPAPGGARGEWKPLLGAGARLAIIVPGGGMLEAAGVVRDLVADGVGDQILLGFQDDPMSMMERFPIALMVAGLAAVEVRKLFVDNPARMLTLVAKRP